MDESKTALKWRAESHKGNIPVKLDTGLHSGKLNMSTILGKQFICKFEVNFVAVVAAPSVILHQLKNT